MGSIPPGDPGRFDVIGLIVTILLTILPLVALMVWILWRAPY